MKKLSVSLSILLLGFATNSFADSAKLVNPTNNHAYKRFDAIKTWTQAKNACVKLGAHLVTITDQAEDDWIFQKKLASSSALTFIGGTDTQKDGVWKWVTDEPFSYIDWMAGNPNGGTSENYLVLLSSVTGFGDYIDKPLPYICEWEKPLKNYTSMITSDTNNDNVDEFVLIGNDGVVNKVISIDRQNKTVISEVDFSAYPTYEGISLSVIDDMNNNGKAEFSLLLTKKSDGSSVIETRDSGTGELLESYVVPR